MPLVEHVRELRRRLVKAAIAIVIASIVGWYLFDPLFDLLKDPYVNGVTPLLEDQGIHANLTIEGVAGAFMFRLKLAVITGVVLSAPFWMWQLWAFVLPALHKHERRWVVVLTATCGPLFLIGIALGYVILESAIKILIGFTPDSILVLTTLGDYLGFVLQMLLVFGLAAQIPVVVILLRSIGAVSRHQLARWRPWTIVGIFVFAAAATPTADPLTMLFLAVPMTVLYLAAEVISLLFDRRKAASRNAASGLSDDDMSPLD